MNKWLINWSQVLTLTLDFLGRGLKLLPTTTCWRVKHASLVQKLALMSAEVAAGGRCARISLLVIYSMSQPVVGCARRRRWRWHRGGSISAARCQPWTSHCRWLHVERQSITRLLLLLLQRQMTFAAHPTSSEHRHSLNTELIRFQIIWLSAEGVNPVAWLIGSESYGSLRGR